MAKKKSTTGSYGIAEWCGQLYRTLGSAERQSLLSWNKNIPCRFMAGTPTLAPKRGAFCNKKGGVCSLRSFDDGSKGMQFGEITATCPARFLEDGLIVKEIGKLLLDTPTPLVAKEIPFLKRPPGSSLPVETTNEAEKNSADEDDPDPVITKKDVGKIDMVCAHPDLKQLKWCAVEMQAVYFSGGAISKDFNVIRSYSGNGIPKPGAGRRPDYRSSGPKRLMPQLQIKVPTLRRWGKKMVVVIDRPFFNALGKMDYVGHVSNADIVWIVVQFDEQPSKGIAKMSIAETHFTTLERAVEGLTAGVPTTLPDFEKTLLKKLSDR